MADTTFYYYDEYHNYYICAKCELKWVLGNDYSLKENQMYYCPKCGRYIGGAEGGSD